MMNFTESQQNITKYFSLSKKWHKQSAQEYKEYKYSSSIVSLNKKTFLGCHETEAKWREIYILMLIFLQLFPFLCCSSQLCSHTKSKENAWWLRYIYFLKIYNFTDKRNTKIYTMKLKTFSIFEIKLFKNIYLLVKYL